MSDDLQQLAEIKLKHITCYGTVYRILPTGDQETYTGCISGGDDLLDINSNQLATIHYRTQYTDRRLGEMTENENRPDQQESKKPMNP